MSGSFAGARVHIDPNVRTGGNGTFAGFEDIYRADPANLRHGDHVWVFEPESGLEGPAVVDRLDFEKELIYLRVAWRRLQVPDLPVRRVRPG